MDYEIKEFGLPKGQEPKYTVDRATGRIINRSTGQAIPDDEPVLIFRAKDSRAVSALMRYAEVCENPDHRAVVHSRIKDFAAFAQRNPQRMREPTTNTSELAAADLGPRLAQERI
jgi:hypothetical protein